MNIEQISGAEAVLESLTRTLLYEGYSLYPYYRSAIKNQKPIPFGVIFPEVYNAYHVHAHSKMQSQCIVTGGDALTLGVSVRFLHLRKCDLFQKKNFDHSDDYVPVFSLEVNDKIYQAGWQTIERKIAAENLPATGLINNCRTIEVHFDSLDEGEIILDESNEVIAKQIVNLAEVKGRISIEAERMTDCADSFRLTVTVINTTPVENAGLIKRDEAMRSSFLSTHIILQANGGEFISHQDPPEKWKNAIGACNNLNTWPIVIDKSNTTLLSSPIILYDYPEINPRSSGDMFDSTEIEEALLLHVNLFSDEEKKKIGSNDEKLQAMLNKAASLTPEDLNNYHSMLRGSSSVEFTEK